MRAENLEGKTNHEKTNILSAYLACDEDFEYGTEERAEYEASVRAILESIYGQVWTTSELRDDFVIDEFSGWLAWGRRKSDNVKVVIDFLHRPRFYFDARETH
jgi:hypothetical protein